jgi:hypothetical protein
LRVRLFCLFVVCAPKRMPTWRGNRVLRVSVRVSQVKTSPPSFHCPPH